MKQNSDIILKLKSKNLKWHSFLFIIVCIKSLNIYISIKTRKTKDIYNLLTNFLWHIVSCCSTFCLPYIIYLCIVWKENVVLRKSFISLKKFKVDKKSSKQYKDRSCIRVMIYINFPNFELNQEIVINL